MLGTLTNSLEWANNIIEYLRNQSCHESLTFPLQIYLLILCKRNKSDMSSYLVDLTMDTAKSHLSVKKSITIMALGLLAFIAYLYFFVGFGEILEIIREVDPFEYFLYYSLTIVAIILSVLFYSMVWHELLKALLLRIGLRKSFLYSWIGNFVDLVVPLEAISGEVTRAYLVYNDLKENFGETVASLVCHRIISIFTTLSMLIVSSLYLILRYPVEARVLYLLTIVAIGTAVTIGVLLYLSAKEAAAEKLVNMLIRMVGIVTRDRAKLANLRVKAKDTLSSFHKAVKTFRNPKYLAKPIAYSYVSWLFHLAIYFLVFYALGFKEITGYFSQIVIVFSISLAVQTIPVAFPVGLVEIVMTSLYVLFGISPAISGVATTLIRVITFWFQILVGYLIVEWIGVRHLLRRRGSKLENSPSNDGSR